MYANYERIELPQKGITPPRLARYPIARGRLTSHRLPTDFLLTSYRRACRSRPAPSPSHHSKGAPVDAGKSFHSSRLNVRCETAPPRCETYVESNAHQSFGQSHPEHGQGFTSGRGCHTRGSSQSRPAAAKQPGGDRRAPRPKGNLFSTECETTGTPKPAVRPSEARVALSCARVRPGAQRYALASSCSAAGNRSSTGEYFFSSS